VAETEEIKRCFYCGAETTALTEIGRVHMICGRCFIYNLCMSYGPNRYDEEFVNGMRRGLEDFIWVIKSREGPQRG